MAEASTNLINFNLDAEGKPIPVYIPSGSRVVQVTSGAVHYYAPDGARKTAYGSGLGSLFTEAQKSYDYVVKQTGTTPKSSTEAYKLLGQLSKSKDVSLSTDANLLKETALPGRPRDDQEDQNMNQQPATQPASTGRQTSNNNARVELVEGGQLVDGQFQANPNYGRRTKAAQASVPSTAAQLPARQSAQQQMQSAPVESIPEFVNLNGAYFRQTEQGYAAVNEPEILRGLQTGRIQATEAKELPSDANAFTPTLSSEAGATRIPPQSNAETYSNYQSMFNLPDMQAGMQQFNANPLGSIQEITNQILGQLGFGEANSLIEDITGELEGLENKRDDEIRAINDDPWLTEGVRLRRVQKVQEKYEDRINNRVNRLRLLESTRDDARQNAQFALGTAISLWDSERRFQQEQVQFYYQQAQQQFTNQLALQNLALSQESLDLQKSQAARGTSGMQEYLFAVETGQFNGSFLQWKATEAAVTRAPQTTGFTPEDLAKNILEIKSAVRSDPQYSDFLNVLNGYQNVKVGAEQDSAAGDLAIVNGIAKMLDPTGVVRPAEFDTVEEAQGWLEQKLNIPAKISQGRIIAPGGMERFTNLADSLIVEKGLPVVNNFRTSYTPVSLGLGVDLATAVPEIGQIEGIIGGIQQQGPVQAVEKQLPPQEQVFNEVVSPEPTGGVFSNFIGGLLSIF